MKSSKSFAVLTAITLAVTLLSGAVAAPILCRSFYYAHIGPLRLEERTGLTREEIKTAFDEMLDYCTGSREEFSTGVLKWSEDGKSHFTDVRFLFRLDLNVFSCALGLLAALDFDRAFVVFHALFFPGKTNWLFDPREDQIINILPQEFFRNCASLILAILVLGCSALIAFDFLWKGGRRKSHSKLQKF